MTKMIKRFLQDDSGAITVDWVVLTGGIVVLAMVVHTIVTEASYQAAATGINARVVQATNIATP